jgi:DNA-binding Lrp family transcriptional regulator
VVRSSSTTAGSGRNARDRGRQDRRPILALFAAEPRWGARGQQAAAHRPRNGAGRLDKLASRGVVTGWGADLDAAALGFPVTAFVTLEIAQTGHDEIGARLAAIPEVIEVHTITGGGDLLARVVARSNADLQRVIDQVVATDGIGRTSTAIALATQVPHRVLPSCCTLRATTTGPSHLTGRAGLHARGPRAAPSQWSSYRAAQRRARP